MSHGTRLFLGIGAIVSSTALMTPATRACSPGQPVVFLNASILSMDSAVLMPTSAILIQNGVVAGINPDVVPDDVCRVEAAGKVLLPGLSDMHVHTTPEEMPIFLANGVTMVREMNGSQAHLDLREQIAKGTVIGPRLLVASTLMVGAPLQYRHRLITSVEQAFAAAHDVKNDGYDYIKIYDGLSLPAYNAFVEAGKTLEIPLDGHIPAEVGLQRVLDAGQSLQHMDKLAFVLAGHGFDSTALAKARTMFEGRNVWLTPTLASLRVLDGARTTEYADRLNQPEMAWVDSETIAWWQSLSGSRTRQGPSPFYRMELALLSTLHKAGVHLLLGTDAANPLMVAGFSVHDELAILTSDGGLTPYEALMSATRRAGEFIGDSLRGRVVVGAPADLILADRNPLSDLSVLRKPAGVMANGRWFDRQELEALLSAARKR